MKTLIALVLFTSFSAHSAVELYRKEMNNTCVISNNKVIKTITAHKGEASVTTTTKIESSGIEALAKKAFALSSGRTIMEDFELKVIVDGNEATLHFHDSLEASSLISLMSKVCK